MKRILSALLALCMVLSMLVAVPFTVSAENAIAGASADGGYVAKAPTVDKGELTDINAISGSLPLAGSNATIPTEYQISDVAGLKKLDTLQSEANKGLKGYTFYLANDIDLNGVTDFYGIGQGVGWVDVFAGTFDGQGYSIKNWDLKVTKDTTDFWGVGLFSYVGSEGKICNVVMDSTCSITVDADGGAANLSQFRFIGGLVAWLSRFDNITPGATPTVENCKVSTTIISNRADVHNNRGIGGLVGNINEGNVIGCTFDGSVADKYASSQSPVGGIAGVMAGGTIKDCVNAGSVSGINHMGGVVGKAGRAIHYTDSTNTVVDYYVTYTIQNCVNKADLTGGTGGYLGGIAGTAEAGDEGTTNNKAKAYITYCTNSGTITGRADRTGGIIGYHTGNNAVNYCKNTGTITSTQNHVGGIIGYTDVLLQFVYNVNEGTVTSGSGNAGGLIATPCHPMTNRSLVGCANYGDVTASQSAGGLFGLAASFGADISGCVNEGNVESTGTAGAGGFFGQINQNCNVTISNCVNRGHVTASANANIVTGIVTSGATYSATNCENTGIVMSTGYVPTSGTETYGKHHSIGNIRPTVVDSNTGTVIGTSRYDADTIFQVRDVNDLRYLAALVADGTFDFAGKTIYLIYNLDFKTGMTATTDADKIAYTLFAGIGTNDHPFKGTFDGQGLTISNFTLKNETSTSLGFFNATEGATIKNLRLVSSNTNDRSYAAPFDVNPTTNVTAGQGALIGWAKGSLTVDNVYSDYGLNYAYSAGAGGLIGVIGTSGVTNANAIVRISRCTQAGNVWSWSRDDQGGLIGLVHTGSLTVNRCAVTASEVRGSDAGTASARVGGLIGFMKPTTSSLTMEDCLNKAYVYASINIGGLVGASNCPVNTFVDCRNEGSKVEANGNSGYAAISVYSDSGACFVGGLIGQVDKPVTMTNCENNAKVVTAKTKSDGTAIVYLGVGGLIGAATGKTATLTNCVNNGDMDITGGHRHGGLIGTALQATGGTLTITDCTNNGNITSTGWRAAGFIGYHDAETTTITDSVNNGNVTCMRDQCAGFIGIACGGATFTNCTNYGMITTASGSGIIANNAVKDLKLNNVKNYAKLTITNSAQILDGLIGANNSGSGTHGADANCKNYANTAQWEGYQTRVNADGSRDLRLIGSIDNLAYGKVGFKVTFGGKTEVLETYTAYKAIDAAGETVNTPAYRGTDARFFTFVIEDIPTDQAITLTITTFGDPGDQAGAQEELGEVVTITIPALAS